ncbi:hypothetical protein Tco_0026175 [Tanacetum coccineum]
MSSSLAVTSFGLSSDVSDAGLRRRQLRNLGRMAMMVIYFSFEMAHALVILVQNTEVIGLPERLASQVFLEWNVPWWLPVPRSCQLSPGIDNDQCTSSSDSVRTPNATAATKQLWGVVALVVSHADSLRSKCKDGISTRREFNGDSLLQEGSVTRPQ